MASDFLFFSLCQSGLGSVACKRIQYNGGLNKLEVYFSLK